MPAAVGSEVGIYYDGVAQVDEGDVIRTSTGRCYRAIHNRIQQKGKHVGRQHLRVQVIDPSEVTEADTVHPIYWYRRG